MSRPLIICEVKIQRISHTHAVTSQPFSYSALEQEKFPLLLLRPLQPWKCYILISSAFHVKLKRISHAFGVVFKAIFRTCEKENNQSVTPRWIEIFYRHHGANKLKSFHSDWFTFDFFVLSVTICANGECEAREEIRGGME